MVDHNENDTNGTNKKYSNVFATEDIRSKILLIRRL